MSFMVGIATQEGIVLATDSRGYFFATRDRSQRPIAYFDRSFKVFAFENHPIGIATTGVGLVNSHFTSSIIENFIKEHDKTGTVLDPEVVLSKMVEECFSHRFPEALEHLEEFVFMVAGYREDTPYLCSFSVRQIEPSLCVGYGLISSDKPDKRTLLPAEFDKLPLPRAVVLAQNIIKDYASRSDRWQTIGGQTDILIINKDGAKWFARKDPALHIRKYEEFKEQFISGKLELNFLPPYSKKDIISLLN